MLTKKEQRQITDLSCLLYQLIYKEESLEGFAKSLPKEIRAMWIEDLRTCRQTLSDIWHWNNEINNKGK